MTALTKAKANSPIETKRAQLKARLAPLKRLCDRSRALARLAEAGVRYFVRFLWQRSRRVMMVTRLQRSLRRSWAHLPYLALRSAAAMVQGHVRARGVRQEYILLTRGWLQRPELKDARMWQRQVGEAEDQHAQRITGWERERVWVERFSREEAVEDTVLADSGQVVASRVLSHEEYIRCAKELLYRCHKTHHQVSKETYQYLRSSCEHKGAVRQ